MLSLDFYNQYVVDVARNLLGKTLVFGAFRGIITETEAYRGQDDEASHAFNGPTPRSKIMFGPPAHSYVYKIYGMYHCLNIVTEEEGSPSAVLIRGLMLPEVHLDGPGKLCRHLGITKEHNGINLISNHDFYLTEGVDNVPYKSMSRIGIKKAQDQLWRFVVDKKEHVLTVRTLS